ncbi:hypothetical protein CEXT_325311 [Caerostris extrusa]|uniref:Uncharacterized protein n=1 Tax=Caerostris extrusa TaxID=172846 RepID=A0AAV4NLR1_CAEEX|nr:hypothetical protein CEXT_325311 [Caerostris extrusa]
MYTLHQKVLLQSARWTEVACLVADGTSVSKLFGFKSQQEIPNQKILRISTINLFADVSRENASFDLKVEGDSGGPLMVERDTGQWVLAGTVSLRYQMR